MSIVLQSSGGGQITISEPATASNFTQTLPAATGEVMVSGNMPAFSAYQSSVQTLSSNVATKLLFQTEEFDTNNNFASSTFTPTVAGYYQINANVVVAVSASAVMCRIYKNGSLYKSGGNSSGASLYANGVSSLVYCNGTTDYIEIYAVFSVGQNTEAASSSTWVNGSMVRAA